MTSLLFLIYVLFPSSSSSSSSSFFHPRWVLFFLKKVLPSTVNCKRCRVGGKDQRCSRNRVLPAAAGRCSIACTLVNAALVGLHISATFPYLLLIVANYILFYAVKGTMAVPNIPYLHLAR